VDDAGPPPRRLARLRERRRRTLLTGGALLAAALVAAVTAYAAITGTAGGTPPPGYFRTRLTACLPEQQTEGSYREVGVAGCLQRTLLDADGLGDLQTARLELGALVGERPWLHNYCHLAEHNVGKALMRDTADVPSLLLAHPGNTCSWGIGHGLLETFGAAQPTDPEWEAVTATCRSLRERGPGHQEVYSLCADGLGHAAWDHHREISGAARRCRALAEPSAVSACTTGVLMQQYRPAETGKQPHLDPQDLAGYCTDTWPDREPASVEGCATGAGYVLSLSMVGDPVSAALADEATPDRQLRAATTASGALDAALDVCRTMDALTDTCIASVVTNLPLHLLTDPAARARLCDDVPANMRRVCSGT